jgi:phasin family protein
MVMFLSPKNQIFSATKSLLEMQVDVANKLGMKNLEGFSNLVNLNVHAINSSLTESMERMLALMSSRNLLEFFSKVATQTQPNTSRLISYGNEIMEITSNLRDEFFKATQVEVSETSKEMASMLEHMVEHENDSFKNMIQMTKATVKEAQSEVETAQEQVVQAAEKTVRSTRTNHKAADHHPVAKSKKHAPVNSKKANGHSRKATHH